MHNYEDSLLLELISKRAGICLSIYQPTHRHFPGTRADLILFKNILSEAEKQINPASINMAEQLLELRSLLNDPHFWEHQLDGMAIFVADDYLRIVKLPYAVPVICNVSVNFHIKPLLKLFSCGIGYQVLSISQNSVTLYQGNRFNIEEQKLSPEVPSNLQEALGTELTEPHLTVASYSGPGGAGMHHGHGGRKSETGKDLERFFRSLDRAFWEYHSKQSGLPLIIAALPEHISLFREVSHNNLLMSQGIAGHPDKFDKEIIRHEAWRIVEPQYQNKISEAVNLYQHSAAHGAGSDKVGEVAEAAEYGRVESLLLEERFNIAETEDGENQSSLISEKFQTNIEENILDDIAETVLKKGGRIYLLSPDEMPVDSGVAATFRY